MPWPGLWRNGRRARFRFWFRKEWGFKSLQAQGRSYFAGGPFLFLRQAAMSRLAAPVRRREMPMMKSAWKRSAAKTALTPARKTRKAIRPERARATRPATSVRRCLFKPGEDSLFARGGSMRKAG